MPDIAPRTLTMDGMRSILSDEVDRLRSGESTAARANAVANVYGKVLSTFKAELEYARLTGQTPNIPALDPKKAAD